MKSNSSRKVTALAPWFGSNRSLAHRVGHELRGCNWVAVPFAGGMCELRHLTARTILVGDQHRHVINLANVLRSDEYGPMLIRELRRVPFHADALAHAQAVCRAAEGKRFGALGEDWGVCYAEALSYFVCCWMGRASKAGTGDEFRSGLSVRWDAGGGDSATRFRSAVESLRDWRAIMPRCTFVVTDAFAMLDKVKDQAGCGVYCDPPFPDVGDEYRHKFTEAQHRELARRLSAFKKARVVARFYRHPLVEELYPAPHWRWLELAGGKTQANKAAPEVLLLNGEPEPEEQARG